ncbi:MAG: hypothetical protein Q8Q39_00265 [bacterium]|nr:hypothetical protein [bacterium]
MHAQSLPVALTPTRFEFAGYPGDMLSGTIEFWNGTEVFLPVRVAASDFEPQGEEGHIVTREYSPASPSEEIPWAAGSGGFNGRSLREWIDFEYPALSVAPQQKFQFKFSLQIPPNAEPGSYWGALMVENMPGGTEGSAIQVKIGAILLLRVYGEVKEQLVVDSFEVPAWVQAPPVEFAVRLRNTGTVHVKPKGTIEIRNMRGEPVAVAPLPEVNILPGYVRRVEVRLGGDGYWLGRYTAALSLTTDGSTGGMVGAETSFWVIPWRDVGLPVLIILGIFVFIVWKRRNFAAAFRVLARGEKMENTKLEVPDPKNEV